MLSAVLPGVREFRTPLVTGLLWAASLWLMIGPKVSDSSSTAEFIDDLRLTNLPPSLWLGATGLLAYLVGSLLVVRASPFGKQGTRARGWLQRMIGRLEEYRAPAHLHHRILWHTWQAFRRLLPVATLRTWVAEEDPDSQIDYWLRNEFQAELEKGRAPVMRSFLGGCLTPTGFEGFCDAETISADGSRPSIYEGDDNLEMLTNAFVSEVRGEKAAVEVRIQMRHPDLYAEIDRLKVEGEFRLSIFWPMTILIVVLAVAWSPFLLPLLLIPPLLVRDGFRRIGEASEKAWGALMAREVTSPTLDSMEQTRHGEAFNFSERYPALVHGDEEPTDDVA